MPEELIASQIANPPSSAKLLVYDRKSDKITHTVFKNLFDFVNDDVAFILNNTKVIKARVFGHKESGGKAEVLLNSPLNENSFKAYIKGKVRVGTIIFFPNDIALHVTKLLDDGMRIVHFTCKEKVQNVNEVYEILEQIGHVPLPPYIKREDTKEDEKNYQSLFAQKKGAVAAPTASLHFTHKMLEELFERYKSAYITLHVGAGTFKPIESEAIKEHTMHEEYFHLSKDAIALINSQKPLLAVGTTVTRTVEYFVREHKNMGWCNLFLHPNNPPQRVNHLLTNFHLPRSTLLMLVAGFVGLEKTLKLYEEAVQKKYQFFSYGDGMLIL